MAEKPVNCSQEPEFFKVLLPGFSTKLDIPRAFLKHIRSEKLETATIVSPLGKPWNVEVHGDIPNLYFAEGWSEFTQAHDLGVGYFLVFRHEGNMVFSLRVFNLSCCRKEYTPDVEGIVKNKNIKRKSPYPEDVIKSTSEGQKAPGTTSSCTSRFRVTVTAVCRQNKYLLHVPRAFIAATDISTKHQVILRDPEKRLFPVHLLHSTQDRIFFKRSWRDVIVSNNLNPGDVCEFQYPTDSNHNNIMQVHIFKQSTRSRKEYTPDVEGVVKKKKIKRQNPNPTDVVKSPYDSEDLKAPGTTSSCTSRFQVVVRASCHQDKYQVHVPRAFIVATDISIYHQVILRDPEKRLFPVRLLHATQHRTFFSRGWKNFIVSNNLNPGDVCEFHYPTDSNQKNILQVHIFKQSTRRRQLAANSDGRKKAKASKPLIQSQTQRITKKHVVHSEVRNSVTTTSSCTKRFRLTMTPSYHRQNYIYIPVALREATSILGIHPVIKDPNGRLFPMHLCYRSENNQVYLTAGWRKFYVSNDLKPGDICDFQLVADSKEKNMVKVCIFRK